MVRLACLTEDRTDAEQSALLAVASRVDREHNRMTVGTRTWGPGWSLQRPLSDLVSLAMDTRVLGDDDEEVGPPKGHRPPASYMDAARQMSTPCDGCGKGFDPEQWKRRHTPGEDDFHAGCCPSCRKEEG